MAFSPDGGTLFAASSFHTVTVWDVPTRTVNQTLGGSTVHDDVPLALSPNGRYVAAGSWGNRFNVWDLEAEREVELLAGHRGLLLSLAFSPDGKTLASSAQDGKVQFWDPHSGKLKKTLTIGPAGGEIRQLAFGPNGQYLVTANGNGTVYVLRLGK
jgi:WD40 repeat protein